MTKRGGPSLHQFIMRENRYVGGAHRQCATCDRNILDNSRSKFCIEHRRLAKTPTSRVAPLSASPQTSDDASGIDPNPPSKTILKDKQA